VEEARFDVVVSAGSLRPSDHAGVVMAHRWTPGGVVVEADFTGAHLYVLAAAGCVLNDLYREAAQAGIEVEGARVRASGGFDTSAWTSTGIEYEVELATDADAWQVAALVRVVDEVAEIPRALRTATTVVRRAAS
jgi:uncharacterized OsmC-like protein